MNLLIASAGRRCEIVNYFKSELNPHFFKVVAVDITEYAPALYCADKYYVLEKNFDDPAGYMDCLLEVCSKEKIKYVLTLIDPELLLFAENRSRFEKEGIQLIISDLDVIKDTFDKFLFYENFKGLVNMLETWDTRDAASSAIKENRVEPPLIAKPRCGSGSIGITTIHYQNEFSTLKYNHKYHYIFQKMLECTEYGIDVYFDIITGKLVSVFMKEKIALRSGETDKAVSAYNEKIFLELKKLEAHGGFKGPIDMDVFVDSSGEIYINEINPRFGGGYPMAHNCGINFMKLIFNNMQGKINNPEAPEYKCGIKMMKYNQVLFYDEGCIYNGC